MIWVRDFGSTKVSESPEYFVYCELFEMNCWSKRSTLIAKGEFLEVPNNSPFFYFLAVQHAAAAGCQEEAAEFPLVSVNAVDLTIHLIFGI